MSTYNFSSIADAQSKWAGLDDAGKAAAHQYVVNAKADNGETYNAAAGTWGKPSNATVLSSKTVQDNMAKTPGSYYVPYEQAQRDLIATAPTYTTKTPAELEAEANNNANLQINPQATSLQNALRNAILSLDNQANDVNASYATVGQTADRLLGNAQTAGTESAIARGGGRSGAVEYEVGKLKAPIMETVTQAEATKAANLANIAKSKTAAQTAYDEGSTALETQRGSLVAQQLAAIKELDYAKQTGNWERINAATVALANLATQQNQVDNANLRTDIATTGVVPTALNTPVGLRQYAESKGATIEYDATTGTVSLNGKKYTPTQLQANGATLVDGRWQIPESVLTGMF
jgi:hypothetical protein